MMMPTGTLERVFVAFVKPEEWGDYSIYLVNDTPVHYRRVVTLTGMFASADEDLLESTHARHKWGELPPHSAILLEDGDYRDLDFVIWHHLDLVPADTARPPERVPHGQPEERAAVAVDPRSHASPVASHARLPSRTRSWSASH